jgi:hypothetical protein
MPKIQNSTAGALFIYTLADADLHPVFQAIKAGNLAALKPMLSVPGNMGIEVETAIKSPRQLLIEHWNEQYNYTELNNVVTFAARLGHSDIVEYFWKNKDKLGLSTGDFIQTVALANHSKEDAPLRAVVEEHREMIDAYNEEMRPTGETYSSKSHTVDESPESRNDI